MLKKVLLLILVIIVLSSFTVMADDYVPECIIEYESNVITIEGNAVVQDGYVTCYVESPDHRLVYIGSSQINDGTYQITFGLDEPKEGIYAGRIQLGNGINIRNFAFVYAKKSGMRSVGREYEQKVPNNIPDNFTMPSISDIKLEVLNFYTGKYRLTIEDNDFECHDSSKVFFFWRSEEGLFTEATDNNRSVVFQADPMTKNSNVSLIVGIGDGFGNTVLYSLTLKGNDMY